MPRFVLSDACQIVRMLLLTLGLPLKLCPPCWYNSKGTVVFPSLHPLSSDAEGVLFVFDKGLTM